MMEEEKIYKRRSIFIIIFLFSVMALYIGRLVIWQIIQGDEYREKANKSSSSYTFSTEAVRGEIVDVNGRGFAINETGYKVYFDKISVDKDRINEIIIELIKLFEFKGEKWIDILPIEFDGNGGYVFSQNKDGLISELKGRSNLNVNSYASANDCMAKLVSKYRCESFSMENQRKIVSVRYNMTRSGFDTSFTKPYTFAQKVSPELVAIVSENSDKYKGVKITTSATRKCINGSVAPHIIGTVGAITKEDYDKLKDKGYKLNDRMGRDGIEYALESDLRGIEGKKYVEINKKENTVKVLETQNAQPGHTVFLTFDARMQKIATESIIRNIKSIGSSDCIAGGVVALDVRDFSVLAAASCPGYDLNKYMTDDAYFSNLMNDPTKPLIDRSFYTGFAPGSTFKPAVACAALQESIINESSSLFCAHGYKNVRCSTGYHGNISVIPALSLSCNSFFLRAGELTGIERLNYYCKKLGLGVKTGIEIPESEGVLANKDRKEGRGEVWTYMDTMQASIGQSENLLTPMQMATYVATIANGGHRYRTHFVRKVTNYGRNEVIWENDPEKPTLVEETGISPENLDIVKRGMRSVVQRGTGTALAGFRVPVAGKTGTAEKAGHKDNKTFVCFAPYDNPQIAVAVMMEHAGNQGPMFNVVRDVLNAYFDGENIEKNPDSQLEGP